MMTGFFNGAHDVDLSEVLTPGFLTSHTRFKTLDEFLDASGLPLRSNSEVQYAADSPLDEFVANETPFKDWRHMLDSATARWKINRLEAEVPPRR